MFSYSHRKKIEDVSLGHSEPEEFPYDIPDSVTSTSTYEARTVQTRSGQKEVRNKVSVFSSDANFPCIEDASDPPFPA
jgi:hypothetical protein